MSAPGVGSETLTQHIGLSEESDDAAALRDAVTQVARLERALAAADARFAGVVEISADAIISVDSEQRITFFNEGAASIFGYTAAEVMGGRLDLLIPERFRAGHAALVRGFGAGVDNARTMGHRRAISARRKGGDEFPAEASISKFGDGDAVTFNVVLRDVTDRKRREDQQTFLADAASLLSGTSLDHDTTLATLARLAVPKLADCCAVDVIDGGGTCVRLGVAHVDPTKESLLREMAPYDLRDCAQPHALLAVLGGGGPVLVPVITSAMIDESSADEIHRRLLSELCPHSMISVPLLSSGHILGAFTLYLTTSPRVYGGDDLALAEDLAIRAAQAVDNAGLLHAAEEATQARDDMLGIVAHDLRNPLSTILLASGMLLEIIQDDDGAPARRLIDMLRSGAGEMNRLIEDLLDVKRVESGRLGIVCAPESISAIVEHAVEVLRPLAVARSLVLDSTVASDLPPIYADAVRIQQVLSNLVGNAIKFTPGGGRIMIAVEREGTAEVRIAVRDTGPGIPPDQLPHVFGRFWQGKRSDRRGIGLGLAIVKGIVDAHEGRVWVESAAGEGTTFIFTIPIATPS